MGVQVEQQRQQGGKQRIDGDARQQKCVHPHDAIHPPQPSHQPRRRQRRKESEQGNERRRDTHQQPDRCAQCPACGDAQKEGISEGIAKKPLQATARTG
jgi:hypothetical protein